MKRAEAVGLAALKRSTKMSIKIYTALLVGLVLAVSSCNPFQDTISLGSPNGNWILDVTKEDQGANDNDPYWQHISIRRFDEEIIFPGNITKISCLATPDVFWSSDEVVVVSIDRSQVGHSVVELPDSQVIRGITIRFVFNSSATEEVEQGVPAKSDRSGG